MINKIKNIIGLKQKLQITTLMIFAVVLNLVEVLNIGLTIPLLATIVNFDIISSNNLINKIFFDFSINLNQVSFLYIILISIIFVGTIKALLQFIILNKQIIIRNNLMIFFANNLLKCYLSKDWSFHLKNGSSQLIRNVNFKSALIVTQIFNPIIIIATELLLLIFIFFLLIIYQTKISLIIFFIILSISYLFFYISKPKLNTLSKQRLFYSKESFKFLHEIFSITREIIIYNVKKYFINKTILSFFSYLNIDRKINLIRNSAKIFFEYILIILICLFLFLSTKISNLNLNEVIILAGLYLTAALKILPSVIKTNDAFQLINIGKKVLDDLFPDLEIKKNNNRKNYKVRIKNFYNTIKIINLSYKYEGASKNILNRINLSIKKKSITCIIGKSGSGKSTMLDLISGLIPHSSGKIIIDNIEVNSKTYDWKNLIGYCTQNVNLIDDSLIKNIILEKQINYKNIQRANKILKECQLLDLKKSIDETRTNNLIGENARTLSGGEKQRINIARALFENKKIIILDEPTSSLDKNTENEIINLLKKLKKKYTLIIVTHKNHLDKFADNIYQIKEKSLKKVK